MFVTMYRHCFTSINVKIHFILAYPFAPAGTEDIESCSTTFQTMLEDLDVPFRTDSGGGHVVRDPDG